MNSNHILSLFFVGFSLLLLSSCGIEDPELSDTLFENKLYDLKLSSNPSEGGSVYPPSQSVEPFQEIEIVAIPRQEWRFTGWTGDFRGTEPTAMILMDGNKTISANFELRTYPLEIITIGQGTYRDTVIQAKSNDYAYGTRVELTAIPARGWAFSKWEGDVSSKSAVIEVVVNEKIILLATFERKEYTLITEVDGKGAIDERIVQGKSTDYPFETIVQLTAIPESGWQFIEWSGDLTGPENPQQLSIDTLKQVKAYFLGDIIEVQIVAAEGGTASIRKLSGSGLDSEFRFDDVVEIEAKADEGWEFAGWSGDIKENESTFQFTLTSDVAATANFRKQSIPLVIQKAGRGEVLSDIILRDTTFIEYGREIRLEAKASTGWRFIGWNGPYQTDLNPLTLTVTSPITIEAVFHPNFYLLELLTEPEEIGEIIVKEVKLKSESYPHGSLLRLTPISNEDNWFFKRWKGDLSGSQAPVDLIFNKPATIIAEFDQYCPESVQDRSGNFYNVVRIGDLCWTASNLRTDQYLNGDYIDYISNQEEWNRRAESKLGAMVNYQTDQTTPPFTEEQHYFYGSLYNIYAALDPRGICPQDWRIPAISDWKTMLKTFTDRGEDPSILLKKEGKEYWKEDVGINSIGFNAVGNGKHDHQGSKLLREHGWIWSSSRSIGDEYFGAEFYDVEGAQVNTMMSNGGFVGGAIRCITAINQPE